MLVVDNVKAGDSVVCLREIAGFEVGKEYEVVLHVGKLCAYNGREWYLLSSDNTRFKLKDTLVGEKECVLWLVENPMKEIETENHTPVRFNGGRFEYLHCDTDKPDQWTVMPNIGTFRIGVWRPKLIELKEYEKMFVSSLRESMKWMCRNENGELMCFGEPKTRPYEQWKNGVTYVDATLLLPDDAFEFVRFEDKDPVSVEELKRIARG